MSAEWNQELFGTYTLLAFVSVQWYQLGPRGAVTIETGGYLTSQQHLRVPHAARNYQHHSRAKGAYRPF